MMKMEQGTYNPATVDEVTEIVDAAVEKAVNDLMNKLSKLIHDEFIHLTDGRDRVINQFAWILVTATYAGCHAHFQNPLIAQLLIARSTDLSRSLYEHMVKHGAMGYDEMVKANQDANKEEKS